MITIEKQFVELKKKYKKLRLQNENNNFKIIGLLGFTVTIKNIEIKDAFNIIIIIPFNYPREVPTITETDNRIPKEFHRNKKDETLCLETPFELKKIFLINPTLFGYIENCVIPFLASFCYWTKTGNMPFGEHAHGVKGILQNYKKLFNTNDSIVVVGLLSYLSIGIFPRREKCICGSVKRFGGCHKKKLKKMKRILSSNEFYYEYKKIVIYLITKKVVIPKKYIINRLIKEINNNIVT